MKGKSPNNRVLAGVVVAVMSISVQLPQSVAQTVTGSILGTIRDQQGAVIPKASVSAKNLGTGAERSAVSDASGGFSIVSLPAGSYDVTASAPGFQTELQSGVTLTVGASLRVDFTLNVGAVTERVDVTGESVQVDTTTSTMAGLVSDTVIRELPLNGRDWLQLAVLQPGVQAVELEQAPNPSRGLGTQMSISGGRPSQNVYRVDGLVTNDQTNKSPGSALGGNMGVDAIREFSVLTNTYSAEYGRGAGGVINAITKSGTNSLHGTAFYFLRNSALDARNFFDATLPPFRRHQFGGSLGGPIKKDKLFYFGNYEGLRQFLSVSLSSNTLSPNARNGILASSAPVTVDPRVKPYLSLYPLPNGPITGDTGRFIAGAGQFGSEDYAIERIDYQLSSNTALAASYTFDEANFRNPDVFDVKLTSTQTRNQRVMLSLQHVFSPVVLNTIRAGFNRVVASNALVTQAINPLLTDPSLGFLPGQGVGSIVVTGLDQLGGFLSAGVSSYWYTAPQWNDDLSWVKGRNNIRIGFSVEAIRNNAYNPNLPTGRWTFGSIRDFLTDTPQLFQSDVPGTDAYSGLRGKLFGAYLQDDVRFRPNLTLNLGVRYEPATVVTEVNGKAAPLRKLSDPQLTVGNPMYQNPTLRNFAPRVGVAWDPSGTGKTAIRLGFGIFDVAPLPHLFDIKLPRSAPFFESGTLNSPPPSSFPNGAFSLLGPSSLTVAYVEPTPSSAYKLQWNFNIQRQLTRSLSFMAGYVGSSGVHLPLTPGDTNMVPPFLVTIAPDGHLLFPTTRPFQVINPNFGPITAVEWEGSSIYHSLQLNVAQQMRHGLTFQGVYVWSKSIDNGSTEFGRDEIINGSENPYPFMANLNRSVSNWDTPHHLSVNLLWDAPMPQFRMALSRFLLSGWEVSGIFTAQSGAPYTVTIPVDRAGTGISGNSNQRPDFKPGPGCSSPNATNPGNPSEYVNLACFAFPAPGTLGNLGRNVLRTPNLQNFDFSLFKNHNLLSEKLKVQFRSEFFNLFNRANFGGQLLNIFNSQGQPVPANAALLPPTVTRSRQIQFGLKLVW